MPRSLKPKLPNAKRNEVKAMLRSGQHSVLGKPKHVVTGPLEQAVAEAVRAATPYVVRPIHFDDQAEVGSKKVDAGRKHQAAWHESTARARLPSGWESASSGGPERAAQEHEVVTTEAEQRE
jgi:hypothetical protein